MDTFNITKPVGVVTASASIDGYYGPFKNLFEACQEVPQVLRLPGRVVGIIENNAVVDYWWKAGIEDSDLVPKNQPHGIYNYDATVVEVPPGIETVIKTIVIPANTFKNLDVLDFAVLGTSLLNYNGQLLIHITHNTVLDDSNKLFNYYNLTGYIYGTGFSFWAKANGILVKNNQLICNDYSGDLTQSSSNIPFNPTLEYSLVVKVLGQATTLTTELLTLKKTN